MKCGILTFHRAVNYGAVLQSFALYKSISKVRSCEIIDYRSRFIENYYTPWKLLLPRNIKRLIAYLIYNGNLFPNIERFNKFLRRNNCLSDKIYRTEDELKKAEEEYVFFISGSDQVWSPYCAGFDKCYFLDFVEETQKKRSYAASFGLSSIPQEYIREYADMLGNFYNYSLREKSGKKIIFNLVGKDEATIDLDPTLLLDRSEWAQVINNKEVRESLHTAKQYILLYCISENEEILKIAKDLGHKMKCDVLYITDRWRKRKDVKCISKVNIDEWLYLFLHADTIVTDSFHGTAFSINFNKKFIVYQSLDAKRSSRIVSLLDTVGLNQNLTNNANIEEKINCINNIDYKIVNLKIEKVRELSTKDLNIICS